MDVNCVERRVAEIAGLTWDREMAHVREDEIHQDVLRAIASGSTDASDLAAAALKTLEIEFDRWYA